MKAARDISSEDVEAQSVDLVETCGQVEGGYNSNTTSTFANEWTAYAYFLEQAMQCFRYFEDWDGDGAAAFEGNFQTQKGWLESMAGLCRNLADDASTLVSAHQTLIGNHILYDGAMYYQADVEALEDEYASYDDRIAEHANKRQKILDKLADLQTQSDDAVATYQTAIGSFKVINPTQDSSGINWDLPRMPFRPGSDPSPDPTPVPHKTPDVPDPTGMPSSAGTPSTDDATPDDATAGVGMPAGSVKGPSLGAGGVKPASFGGGMPLRPLLDGESPSGGPGRGAGGPGRGIPGAGGAMGGGGTGAAPMGGGGHGGQGENQAKGKRVEGEEDESIYTEDRPWTEAYIGSLRRKEIDGKESK